MWENQSLMEDQAANSQDTANLFQDLVKQSLAVIQSSLNQLDISPQERLNIALKILEISSLSQSTNYYQSHSKIEQKLLSELKLSNSQKNSQPETLPSIETITLTPNFFQIYDFFSKEDYFKLLNLTLNNQNNFIVSDVMNEVTEYRKSYVLLPRHFPDLQEFLATQILTARPSALQKLNVPMFLVSHLEMQITAHSDGGYYKIHQDIDQGKIANRALSYVYYFYREPKPFYGGELRLYQTKIQGNKAFIEDQFIQVEPRNNSIVFFDSRLKHEVMPVYCPSKQFEDSRFTLNGWIHR